jgi:hypothetical protein
MYDGFEYSNWSICFSCGWLGYMFDICTRFLHSQLLVSSLIANINYRRCQSLIEQEKFDVLDPLQLGKVANESHNVHKFQFHLEFTLCLLLLH